MSWHYQVIKSVYEDEEIYSIHEAYVDEYGNLYGVTQNPVTISAESLTELKGILGMIKRDIDRHPVILDTELDSFFEHTNSEDAMNAELLSFEDVDEMDLSDNYDEDLVDIFKKNK